MKQKVVLFVSAGRTDLQLMTTDQHSVDINKDTLRIFHDWLWQHPENYVVTHESDAGLPLYIKKGNHNLTVERVGGDLNLLDAKDKNLYRDAQGRCLVVPTKLGRIITALQNGPYEIVAAVVFNTHRNLNFPSGKPNPFANDEPYASGKVLAHWLASCFSLQVNDSQQPALGQADWVNILQGEENQEGRDKLLNTEAVNRVVKALQIFADKRSGLHAVLCGIGGIPAFKALIRNSAYFYFPERCLLAEDTEQQQSSDDQPTIKPVGDLHITPEQSFALRANVAKLIASGDFLGAEAAIRYVQDEAHQAWTNPIRQVANWFRGIEVKAEHIGDDDLRKLLIHDQAAHANCLLPGLRTEAALQGGRYVEAISATAAYIDVALGRGIDACLNRYGTIQKHEPPNRVKYASLPQFPSSFNNTPSALSQERDKHNKPVPLTYRYNSMGEANRRAWAKASGIPGLDTLIARIDTRQNGLKPYSFRNTNTHNVLSPDELEQAQKAFYQARLWTVKADGPTASTLYFLGNPEVKTVAAFFGVADIGEIYFNLVRLLEARMADFRWPG